MCICIVYTPLFFFFVSFASLLLWLCFGVRQTNQICSVQTKQIASAKNRNRKKTKNKKNILCVCILYKHFFFFFCFLLFLVVSCAQWLKMAIVGASATEIIFATFFSPGFCFQHFFFNVVLHMFLFIDFFFIKFVFHRTPAWPDRVWKAMGTEACKNQLKPDRVLKGLELDWKKNLWIASWVARPLKICVLLCKKPIKTNLAR